MNSISQSHDYPSGIQSAENTALCERLLGFPQITYEEFATLPEDIRREIIKRNKILQTDTYNRTMCHAKGEDWKREEVYTLQFRRAPAGYLIVHGVRAAIENIARMRVTEAEFQFAREFYQNHANVPYFNEDMWRMVIDRHNGHLPLEIDALPDGTAILPGDPVLRVKGPGELAAHFEPQMHRIFYETLVATTAHEIATKIGAHRFIEVGKRGTMNEEMHLQAAAAMQAANINLTSNDAAAACYRDLRDVGTLGHRFIQHYKTEEQAFRQAIETCDSTSLLIDMIDPWKGIDMALKLKKEYRDQEGVAQKIWIRLDSDDITAQTIHVLTEYKKAGFMNPSLDKIVVEDVSTVDDMVKIDEALKEAGFSDQEINDHVVYGAGGLLVTKQKSRSDASSGYKLSEVDGRPTMKYAGFTGKESDPGRPELLMVDGKRMVAQEGEFPEAESLFVPAYREGEILMQEDTEAVRARVERTFAQIQDQIEADPKRRKKTPRSPETKQKIYDLAVSVGMQDRLPDDFLESAA